MTTTTQRVLTKIAADIAMRLAQRYGNLKSVLSAGIMALDELSPTERERMLDKANGIESADESQKAAESARFCVKIWTSLDPKQKAVALQFLGDDESHAIKDMLNAINPEIQATKRKSRSKIA